MAILEYLWKWANLQTPMLIVIALLLATVARLAIFRKSRRYLPPGPTPLPLLGNFHQLAIGGVHQVQWTLIDWAKQFGDVYTVHMGTETCIVLNSYKTIKEAFSMQSFTGRPHNFLSDEMGENMGVLFTEGESWKDLRRFTLMNLKDLGVGKLSFEDKIITEVENLMHTLKLKQGEPTDLQFLVSCSVANVISSVLWSKQYSYNDPELNEFLHIINENIIAVNNLIVLISVLPVLRNFPVIGTKTLLNNKVIVEAFTQAIIDDHKATINPNNVRDFVDAFLVQIEKTKNTDDKNTPFTENQLLKVLGELFVAGLETTSTTLRWALLYLTLNQDVQEKARREIQSVVGKGTPSMRDRAKLPYIEAVLTETHRIGRVVSTGVPHASVEEVNFGGYVIPKGTPIIANMAAVLMNEDEFPEPLRFLPERFLNDDGSFNKSSAEHVIPFSVGRRVCLGESLARMELFLYLTCLLQRFTITLPEGAPPPSVNGVQGFTYLPQAHQLCLNPI